MTPTEAAITKLQGMHGGNACVHQEVVRDHGQAYRLTIIAEHADIDAGAPEGV